METATRDAEILARISVLEVERAKIEAETASLMLEFADLRRTQAQSNPNETAARLEASFAADELGVALHQPTRTVQCRLAEARRVRGLLPMTWLAFQTGRIDTYRVSLIASAVDKVRRDNHAVIELDHWAPGKAATSTTAQLKGWLRRFTARNAPDHQAARAEQDKRAVWVAHHDDGMSSLHAYIPTADAVRIDAALTAAAKTMPADGRTLDQRRAYVFCNLLLGHHTNTAGSSRTAVIGVTIPVTSLAGLTDAPERAQPSRVLRFERHRERGSHHDPILGTCSDQPQARSSSTRDDSRCVSSRCSKLQRSTPGPLQLNQ